MWADTLLHAEQQHVLRLLAWAGLSILAATALATFLIVKHVRSPFLKHFAIQMAVWGVVAGALGGIAWPGEQLRDLAGAARLERLTWLLAGTDIGVLATGVAIALTGWIAARRQSLVGAGVAVATHGVALLVVNLQFAALISR